MYWAGGAAVLAAAIGAGSSYYASEEQRKANDKSEDKADEAQVEALAAEDRIMQDVANQNKNKGATVTFGTDDDEEMGTYDDFMTPITSTSSNAGLGGQTTTSSLGFKV